jgi:hypothetical protein
VDEWISGLVDEWNGGGGLTDCFSQGSEFIVDFVELALLDGFRYNSGTGLEYKVITDRQE